MYSENHSIKMIVELNWSIQASTSYVCCSPRRRFKLAWNRQHVAHCRWTVRMPQNPAPLPRQSGDSRDSRDSMRVMVWRGPGRVVSIFRTTLQYTCWALKLVHSVFIESLLECLLQSDVSIVSGLSRAVKAPMCYSPEYVCNCGWYCFIVINICKR